MRHHFVLILIYAVLSGSPVYAQGNMQPETQSDEDSAFIQHITNEIIEVRPGIDDLGSMTLEKFVDCLRREAMPTDPTGKKRKVGGKIIRAKNEVIISFGLAGVSTKMEFHMTDNLNALIVDYVAIDGIPSTDPSIDTWRVNLLSVSQTLQGCSNHDFVKEPEWRECGRTKLLKQRNTCCARRISAKGE